MAIGYTSYGNGNPGGSNGADPLAGRMVGISALSGPGAPGRGGAGGQPAWAGMPDYGRMSYRGLNPTMQGMTGGMSYPGMYGGGGSRVDGMPMTNTFGTSGMIAGAAGFPSAALRSSRLARSPQMPQNANPYAPIPGSGGTWAIANAPAAPPSGGGTMVNHNGQWITGGYAQKQFGGGIADDGMNWDETKQAPPTYQIHDAPGKPFNTPLNAVPNYPTPGTPTGYTQGTTPNTAAAIGLTTAKTNATQSIVPVNQSKASANNSVAALNASKLGVGPSVVKMNNAHTGMYDAQGNLIDAKTNAVKNPAVKPGGPQHRWMPMKDNRGAVSGYLDQLTGERMDANGNPIPGQPQQAAPAQISGDPHQLKNGRIAYKQTDGSWLDDKGLPIR